jgi:SAM-dependent methyltransferase
VSGRRGTDDEPLALPAFDELADDYSRLAPTKAHNAYYEHPATMSLLPDLAGLRVLDAGCGPGIYAERLVDLGAELTCFDVSPRMVELAAERVGDRASVRVADMNDPLDFLDDESFDLVISALAVDYVRDWDALFAEFARVLRDGGLFVFSVEHPFSDFTYRHMSNYFEPEVIGCTWRGFGKPVEVSFCRRPLSTLLNSLVGAGLALDRMLEPRPIPEFKAADPDDYEKLMRRPGFLCLRARRVRRSGR